MKESLQTSEVTTPTTAGADMEHADESRLSPSSPSCPSSPPSGTSPPPLRIPEHALDLVQVWFAGSGITRGPLFRAVRKNGVPGDGLDPSQVSRIYKSMAMRAGFVDFAGGLSGHSARVGAAQDMIASGIGLPAILQAGRWKSAAMVSRYGERLLASRGAAAQLARMQGRDGKGKPGMQ